MDGTSRQSNSGRTLEVAGTWGEGKVVVVTLFFFCGGKGRMEWARGDGQARLKATDPCS